MGRFLIAILLVLFSPESRAETPNDAARFEAEARTLCESDADVAGFAERFHAFRDQHALTDDDLIKYAPTSLLRLAEIERVQGQFDAADKDYAVVAALSGPIGDTARGELATLAWDRKLREISGSPADGAIVSDARKVSAGENSAWVVALWRKPVINSPEPLSCPEGLFTLSEQGPATLALYDLWGDTSLTRFRQAITIDFDASDISTFEALPNRRAIVSVALISLGNCFACESGSANFFVTDKDLRRLEPPGVGSFRGPPTVSNDEIFVTTIDTRWEHFGGFAHADGSSIESDWRLQGVSSSRTAAKRQGR